MERMEGVRLMKGVDELKVEGRRRRGTLKWEDCVMRDLGGVGGECRMRAMGCRDGSETMMKKYGKQKSMTGISASLTSDYRDKDESNNISTANNNYLTINIAINNKITVTKWLNKQVVDLVASVR